YHLMIANQVAQAGGPIAYEWWEFAPEGRPHLYPPLLHVLLAAGIKLGLSPLTVIRLASTVLLPTLLVSIWAVVRRLFGSLTALCCLWMAMVPFSFHLHSTITLAATLGMILLLWMMVALESNRWFSAGLLLALLSYTHLGIPIVALTLMAVMAVIRSQTRKTIFKAFWGLFLVLPWGMHLWNHREVFHVVPRMENEMLELVPIILVFSAIGFWHCCKQRGSHLWLLAMLAGFLWFSKHHAFRWLSGEGMLPIILLAGVGMCAVAQPVRRHALWVTGFLFAISIVLPTRIQTPKGWQWRWQDTAAWHLLHAPGTVSKALDASFTTHLTEHLAQTTASLTQPDEILWSNFSYAMGSIAALAKRPMSSAMLNEVAPATFRDPIQAAHLIIWFKVDERLPGSLPSSILKSYSLTRVAEDDLAILYRQQGQRLRAHFPQAVLPLGVILGFLGAALGFIGQDLLRSGKNAVSKL
ncbi:MAG: hypothetical protein HYT88_01615, partial [Candidatus Omnitrophica bacterium]|nr:hypothetical protein [Candidatus Omnitrophota bacterium]